MLCGRFATIQPKDYEIVVVSSFFVFNVSTFLFLPHFSGCLALIEHINSCFFVNRNYFSGKFLV